MKTIKLFATTDIVDRAKRVYQAQMAVNSCGLSHDFRDDLLFLLTQCELGTDSVNQHPITILWIDKFASLARCQQLGNTQVMCAYDAIHSLMTGHDVEWEVIPMC